MNTAWNADLTFGLPFRTPEFDSDGQSGFSDSELEEIQLIWQRVAEDFIAFDVNITTEDPGVEALTNSGGADEHWGLRVAVGGSCHDWYVPAGGVAYEGSFTWDSDTPAYVFEKDVPGVKAAAETISHEVGHSLGLHHDGDGSSEYYRGHGDWSPIMGLTTSHEVTQWSRGDYEGANNQEDDLEIITTQNGFGYRPDDFANTTEEAVMVTADSGTLALAGIIEQNTDEDIFAINVEAAGELDLAFLPAAVGANLDIDVILLDEHGNVVATNDQEGLSARIVATLEPGTYYVCISGKGHGAVNPDYSDYGSIGAYSVEGTLPTAQPSIETTTDQTSVDQIPGDTNGDGVVSFQDFLILSQNFGTTDAAFADGDFDGNGTVGFEDFLILAQNFGA